MNPTGIDCPIVKATNSGHRMGDDCRVVSDDMAKNKAMDDTISPSIGTFRPEFRLRSSLLRNAVAIASFVRAFVSSSAVIGYD
eukprot:CCRYP_004517-RC/>CCRYP_004517-RC protein AED:0.48 eAED:1.00 QI:0/0/0/1/0/0/2/0/82